MKILALVLLLLLICLEPVNAAPASPIWAVSVGFAEFDPLNGQYFGNDPNTANRLLQGSDLKYLTVSAKFATGTRFSLGYGFGPNEVPGYDNKVIAAGIDRRINENWWVSVGYERSRSLFSGINIGATYNISPRAAVSISSSFNNTNDYEWKNTILRTQLYISF